MYYNVCKGHKLILVGVINLSSNYGRRPAGVDFQVFQLSYGLQLSAELGIWDCL